MKRILLAGVLGGLAMFLWGAVSHMLLPTGEAGIRTLPNEDSVITVLKQSVHEHAFYLFPSAGMMDASTDAERQEWERKYAAGPTGVLIYNPGGGTTLSAVPMLIELASNIGVALIIAWVLSLTAVSYGTRVLAALFLGVLAWLSVSVSEWNWYSFPAAFVGQEAVDQVGGCLFAGVVIAMVIRRKKSIPAPVLAT